MHLQLSQQLGEALLSKQWHCAVAESCTGGQLAAAITDVAGSSRWFECGWVTYSNQSKIELLGVSASHLKLYGAVSEAVAVEMAQGVLQNSQANVSVAVTGIAGPEGGTKEKPVGLVWIAWSLPQNQTETRAFHFPGDRLAIRTQTVLAALEGLILRINSRR